MLRKFILVVVADGGRGGLKFGLKYDIIWASFKR